MNRFAARDVGRVPPSPNAQPLGSLLRDFFRFFRDLNLRQGALSLVSGRTHRKALYTSLYVEVSRVTTPIFDDDRFGALKYRLR